MKKAFPFRRTQLAKAMFQPGSIAFGASFVSVWLVPAASLVLKIGLGIAIVVVYVVAFFISPAEIPTGEKENGSN